MPNIDRQSRCTCILPTPSPTPYTPYVSPLCELSKEDIDNILDSIEAYMNDPDEDLPFPSDETIDELDGDCKDAQTFEQKRRIKKLVKENFKDLNAIVTMFGSVLYGITSIAEDVYTNKESRFLEDFGVLSLVGIDEHFISVIQFKSNCPFETGLVISKRLSNRIQKLIC